MEDGAGSEEVVVDLAEAAGLDEVVDQETVSEAGEDSEMAEGLEEAASVAELVVLTASAEAGAASEVETEDSVVVEEDLEAETEEDSAVVEEVEEVSEAVVSAVGLPPLLRLPPSSSKLCWRTN